MLRIIDIFNHLGYEITFAPQTLERLNGYDEQLKARGVHVLYFPECKSIHSHVKQYGKEYGLVLVSRISVATEVIEDIENYLTNARFIFDTVDLHFLRMEREAKIKSDGALLRQAYKTRRQELDMIQRADDTFVVSPYEKEVLEKLCPGSNVHVVSNVHNTYKVRNKFPNRSGMLFIGDFAHPPNVDAIEYFVEDILPLVLKELPEYVLHVIGANAPETIQKLASKHVKLHGHLGTIEPLFQQTKMSVAPLRYGAGVKGKVNLSMSYGLPVVATPTACEGMHVQNGYDILIRESAETFANTIIDLHSNEYLWNQLSKHGQKNVYDHYSYDNALKTIKSVLKLNIL